MGFLNAMIFHNLFADKDTWWFTPNSASPVFIAGMNTAKKLEKTPIKNTAT